MKLSLDTINLPRTSKYYLRSSHIFLNLPDNIVKQHKGFGLPTIDINAKELDAKYYDIG